MKKRQSLKVPLEAAMLIQNTNALDVNKILTNFIFLKPYQYKGWKFRPGIQGFVLLGAKNVQGNLLIRLISLMQSWHLVWRWEETSKSSKCKGFAIYFLNVLNQPFRLCLGGTTGKIRGSPNSRNHPLANLIICIKLIWPLVMRYLDQSVGQGLI